jgi:ornithine carbamoyltransferase
MMAKYSTIPVINGCCDKYHPCQALADMMTIKERFGGYDINLLYIGIHNNVLNSLMETLPHLGGSLYALTPIKNKPSHDEDICCRAEATDRLHVIDSMESIDSLMEITNKMNVIYTDSWLDMEFFNDESYAEEKSKRINLMQKYQLNKELLSNTKALVMHDMPIHCGYEITRDVVENNIDVIMQQSENRRHAQNGVLVSLLNMDI